MKDQKKETVRKINRGAIVSGVGFALYLALLALGQQGIADIVNVVFAVVAVWTFLEAAELRGKDKEAVSYSLLWGTGALALMLGGFAVLMVKQRLGF
ncbi:MAG: hypothetical protein Q4C45_11540 [Oscillospiraceae bacterium]|nr:hypothetical protein [Oscillospiraceae bacterium]